MKALALILVLVLPAIAQMEGNPPEWCREGFFTRDSQDLRVAIVKGNATKRSHIYSGEADPWVGNTKPRTWVVGGDELIVNRSYRGYSCAWFISRAGKTTVGWVVTSDLSFRETVRDASESDWLGRWTYGENEIEFTSNKLAGYLNVTGTAIWKGLGDNVHVGELDGRYEPKNGVITYSDGDDEFDCRARLQLLGRYLIVADNLKCGGVNVSFNGVYTRRKPSK